MSNLADINSSVWGFSTAGFGVVAEGLAAIRQNIEIILKTTKGTDPLRPFFGSDIYTFIDAPVTVAIPNIKRAMIEAVGEWETRVKILSIDHVTTVEKLTFTINYILEDKGLMDTLVISIKDNQIVTGGGQAGTLVVQSVIPANPTKQRYLIDFFINNSSVKPLMPVDGFETINDLFSFILSSWGTYGKWSLLSDRIVCYVDAKNIKTISLNITLSTAYSYRWDLQTIAPGEWYVLHFNANNKDVKNLPGTLYTAGDVITAVNTNWGTFGSWDLLPTTTGYRLTLISNTTSKAFLDITTGGGGDFDGGFSLDFNS